MCGGREGGRGGRERREREGREGGGEEREREERERMGEGREVNFDVQHLAHCKQPEPEGIAIALSSLRMIATF